MTIRQNAPTGAPIWVDLMTSDVEKSKTFYGALLGWTAEDPNPEFGGYTNFQLNGERVAGLMQAQPEMGGVPNVWSVYLNVADAAATVQAARDNGGQVIVDAMAVGNLGTMAVVTDVGGAAIGMWQPGEHRGGVVATTGAPCHFELHTRDFDSTIKFYENVFGWKIDRAADEPGFRYYLLAGMPDGEGAGIMDSSAFLPEGVPAHWSVYFAVDDMDAAVAQVKDLGGSIVQGPENTPYGILTSCTDSTGSLFKLRANN
jgi:predicted enzyme related to lactoylglutathione lyase